MSERMPCSITDGLQYDDWLEQDELTEDEDAAYERLRQEEIDDKIAPMSESARARDVQVGGDHYGPDDKVQAIDLILQQGVGFCEGSAIKYLVRWRKKGGIQDLEKAIHYIYMLIEHEKQQE